MEDKLIDKRLRISKITSVKPDYSGTLVSGNYSYGIEPISFDYGSLYTSTMSRLNIKPEMSKKIIRKKKIKKIFTDI